MPAFALPLAIAGGSAAINFAANQFGKNKNPFDRIINNVNEQFEAESQRGRRNISEDVSRRAASQGFSGGTSINVLIEDMMNNFIADLESRKKVRLDMLQRQSAIFDAGQPSVLQNAASAIGGGLQTGLAVHQLQGGFDDVLGLNDGGVGSGINQSSFNSSQPFNFSLNNPIDGFNNFNNPNVRTG